MTDEILRNLMKYPIVEYKAYERWEPARKHRKKRIAKKWAKRYGRVPVWSKNVIVVCDDADGNVTAVICSTDVIERMRAIDPNLKTTGCGVKSC